VTIDDNKIRIKSLKEDLADTRASTNGLRHKKELKPKTLKEASVSELISFSRFTLIGIVLFLFTVFIGIFLQMVEFPYYVRISTGILGFSILVLLLGLVIDVLRWREFTEWGALGAFISYIGLFLMFVPLILYAIVPPEFEVADFFYIISFGSGVIILIIGFTSHATELDRKIENLLFLMKQWLTTFDFRQFFRTLGQLVLTIVGGFFRYLWKGIKELGIRIKKFFSWFYQSTKFILYSSWVFLTRTFPQMLKRSVIGLWNNLHWIGLFAVFIYLIMVPDLPIPNTDPIFIKVEMVIIICFFFSLGVLYPQRDRVIHIAGSMRTTLLAGVISAYSMLSGTQIKAKESVFCSRCLRGVEKREFKSLKKIKETMNPPCPFCGFNSWIGFEQKPTSMDTITREEEY